MFSSASATHADDLMRRAIPLGVIALLPWLTLAISPGWVYSRPGLIDAWLYHGFFQFLPDFIPTGFGRTYYSTRLAWILPGYTAYRWLPAHAANLTLHLAFFYAALGSLYRAGTILANRSAALIATCAFATSIPTLVAFGWDYVDGAVITYTLIAIWAVVEASVSRHRAVLLPIAGAAAACILHSNVTGVLVVPAIVIAYLSTTTKLRATDAVLFACGGVAITLVMGIASVSLGGRFLFFMPSLQWAQNNVGTNTFDPVPPLQWPGSARFLVPLVGLCASVAAVVRDWNRNTRTALFVLLWLLAAFASFDWILSGGLLQTSYYVSWFLPLAFLALAVAIGPISFRAGIAVAALVCGAQIAVLTGAPTRVVQQFLASVHLTTAVGVVAGGVVLALFFFIAWRSQPVGRAVMMALTLLTANLAVAPHLGYSFDRLGRQQFDAVQQLVTLIRRHVPPGSRPRFWVEAKSSNDAYFTSLASTHLFLDSIASFSYPQFADESHQYAKPGASVQRGDYLMVLSDEPVNPMTVQHELGTLDLGAEIVTASTVQIDQARFVMTLLRLI